LRAVRRLRRSRNKGEEHHQGPGKARHSARPDRKTENPNAFKSLRFGFAKNAVTAAFTASGEEPVSLRN
jgi:hypothetical protein